MDIQEIGLGLALRGLNRFAGLSAIDRIGLREPAERFLYRASKAGFRSAGTVGRSFTAVQRRTRPARPKKTKPVDLFDLSPDDEQTMLRDAVRDFADERLRRAAESADAERTAPEELIAQAGELGLSLLGVPEELGGVVAERSAVTAVLVAEAMGHGDMGLAVACLAPQAVSTALGLWGDADQQARYLSEFAGDNPPVAALAVLEPQPLFDPFVLSTSATRSNGGYTLAGVKALVPRAAEAELFLIAAAIDGERPALFVVESKSDGVFIEPDPAMGVRAASTARVVLEDVQVPEDALVAGGKPNVYRECVHRSRIAWSALAVGTAQAVLDYVIPYVNERVAFGEPVSHRQAVAFSVANIGIELEGMRLATYRAASRADQGKSFEREAALAWRLCADRGMGIGSDGVGLLGGHGYVKEHPVERWFRDLRAAAVMEGALLV